MVKTAAPTGRSGASSSRFSGEQSVLLWKACAYAQDLIDAIESDQDACAARRALLRFIHYSMLPYLRFEETEISDRTVPDTRLSQLQIADHDRIRFAADTIEIGVSRTELAPAVQSLVDSLGRHIRREQAWIIAADLADRMSNPEAAGWTPPLLADRVDIDALPADDRDVLVLDRLQRMRPGEVVRLRASADLHALWCRQHARSPHTHAWVYEQAGPRDWLVRVTRREVD
jgi:uncharacterized protein (DUF2249 family)